MSKDYEYLSDAELENLIEGIETEGLVNAPDDFMSEVLSNIEDISKYRKIEPVPQNRPAGKNILDYSIYCMKVFGSIAAAILIMVMVPFIRGVEQVPDKAEVISRNVTTPREEVISQKPVRSKEEVLYGTIKIEEPDIISDIETWFNSIISR